MAGAACLISVESPADDLVEAVDAAGAGGGTAGLTPAHSITVRPQRVAKCPVNLEAALVAAHPLGGDDPQARGSALTIEVRVTAVHVHPGIRLAGHASRIDPDRWRPLIMSFQHFTVSGRSCAHPRSPRSPRSPTADQ